MTLAGAAVALAALLTPAGGYTGPYVHGTPASFRVGAAVQSFTPPARLKKDPANCAHLPNENGPRPFAFIEPYQDLNGNGHYDGPPDPTNPSLGTGEPYQDCNNNQRWDGNLLGGGGNSPRFYDHVADQVGARAMVVSGGSRTIAVEVTDQEGLFNVYQARIRARVHADGYRLNGIFISATHDESAPDSLGLGGVSRTTSGVNNYWIDFMVAQSAKAIEQAYRAMRPARIRYTEVLEPANLRQCWSSYPYVDDQHMPVLQALDSQGHAIVTLVSVSQHAETLGFNGGSQRDGSHGPTLDQENNWISSDWANFFRRSLERRFGGVGIEMAGSVGSVESPEVYSRAISRTPQQYVDASHPAGCRTLFRVGSQLDKPGNLHVALGYYGETRAWGTQMAAPVIAALTRGEYHWSSSNTIWGARASICIPLQNALFLAAAQAGVFAQRPGYNANCTQPSPVLPNGSTSGTAIKSSVAAFQIGDGEFLSLPGEVFPFTYLRGFQGPQDMPHPADALPPWLLPHMGARFRFLDGLAEDMVGYIFPAGNAVGIPTTSNPNPSGTDRFGCGHSDDAESASAQSANIIGAALLGILEHHDGAGQTIKVARYRLADGKLSRDPLGGPEVKCSVDQTFHARAPATAVELRDGTIVHPRAWMSLSGLPQTAPDRDTRGYFDAHWRRVWLNVYPNAR